MTPTTPSAAGTDPAFIPGVPAQLDGAVPPALRGPGRKPAAGAAKAAKPAGDGTADTAAGDGTADGDDTDGTAADGTTAGEDTAGTADGDAAGAGTDETTADDTDADVDAGKPDFKAADRRGTISADREGITFTLDEEIAEFAWDEIGAVEIHMPRFGRRFSVTVYTGPLRWFQTDVEATSRKQLKQWAAELDTILDAHFEPDEPDDQDAAAAAAGDAPDAEATAAKATKATKAAKTGKAAKPGKAVQEEERASADA